MNKIRTDFLKRKTWILLSCGSLLILVVLLGAQASFSGPKTREITRLIQGMAGIIIIWAGKIEWTSKEQQI